MKKARYVAVSMVTDTQTDTHTHTQTHTHRMTTVTLTHAPRVNDNNNNYGGHHSTHKSICLLSTCPMASAFKVDQRQVDKAVRALLFISSYKNHTHTQMLQ